MKPNTNRLLAYTSVAVLAMSMHGKDAIAQTTVTATLITSSAITVAKVSDMDFGTWLVQFVDGTPSITLTDDGTASTSQTGAIANSIVVEIIDGATEGVVNVQIPAAATITMTRGAITQFVDTNISLNSVSFDTDTTASAPLALNTPVNIVVGAANTNETINLGGIITITGDPADNTHVANFNLTFAY